MELIISPSSVHQKSLHAVEGLDELLTILKGDIQNRPVVGQSARAGVRGRDADAVEVAGRPEGCPGRCGGGSAPAVPT